MFTINTTGGKKKKPWINKEFRNKDTGTSNLVNPFKRDTNGK